MNTPQQEISDEDIARVLPEIMTSILSFAEERRAEDPKYQHLFSSFKDGGVAKAVFEAEKAMAQIAMDLMSVLRANGQEVDRDLFRVALGLPLALKLVRDNVESNEGFGCCADKARLIMKTYFYEKLGMDVEVVPFK